MSSEKKIATLTVASRHHVEFEDDKENLTKGVLTSRKMKAVIGDLVEYTTSVNQKAFVNKIIERKNCFKRSYGSKTKLLAANLDHLFLITAPPPLFNTTVIDRIISSANTESITCSLVFNKSDLKYSQILETLEYYKNLNVKVLFTSAKEKNGVSQLIEEIETSNYKTAAFIGVSGVGKSSLLNAICPNASAQTGQVSEKSGQGKQTTSMPKGYYYKKNNGEKFLIIDLPGIQNFGISHLSQNQIRDSFYEFQEQLCRFNNCMHLEEPECEVINSVQNKKILKTRYESYLEMLEEINQFT